MKVKISNLIGSIPHYLTINKAYDVIENHGGGYVDIYGDDGEVVKVDMNDCLHIGGGSWEIVNNMRENFEKAYTKEYPDDKCTLMPNGNYSGWIKQAHWFAWKNLK